MTTHRIAHLSDIHLAPGAKGAEPRRLFLWTVADLEARVAATGVGLDAIVLNGDLYDGASTPTERNLLAAGVQRLARLAPVVVVKGNHDRPGDLDLLARLHAPHPITVYSEPAVHLLFDGLALALLPWLDRVTPAADVRTYTADGAAERERAALATILDKLAAKVAEWSYRGPTVFCGHLMLEGAVPGLGQPEKHGSDFVLTLADLARVPAAAYLLGHVHTAQRWAIGDAPVAYNGSLHRSAFGEVEAKGYAILTLCDGVATLEAVETPATAMVLLEDAWEAPGEGDVHRWARWTGDAPPDVAGADVRFQYSVAHAERGPARRAAAAVKLAIEAAGARHVKVDPKVAAPVRPKLPAFAAAQSLGDKLGCYFTRERIDPDAPKSRLARALLVGLERALGTVRGGVAAGGMHLSRLSATGIGPFTEPVELDLDALPGEVVAVMGENGAGKSTLLGCFPGALYGSVPDGRALAKLATTDDALLEAHVTVAGAPWLLQRHLARGKAFAVGPDGATADGAGVKATGKIGVFSAWANDHLVPEEVLLAGPFSAQGSEGLIAMRPGERKAVLLRALGCAHYERLAEGARKRRDAQKATLATLGGQIAAEERRRATLPADPGAAVIVARTARDDAQQAFQTAQAELDAWTVAKTAREHRARLAGDVEAARAALDVLDTQAGESAILLSRAGEIRDAAEQDRRLAERLRELDAEERQRNDASEADAQRRLLLAAQWTRARGDAAVAMRRIEDLRATLAAAPATVALTVSLEAALAADSLDAAELRRATDEHDALMGQAAVGLTGRIEALRAALAGVVAADLLPAAQWVAARAIEADDGAGMGALAHAERSVELANTVYGLNWRRRETAVKVAEMRHDIATRTQAEQDARDALPGAEEALATATATAGELATELRELDAAGERRTVAGWEAMQVANGLRAERAALRALAAQADALTRAEVARDALAPALAAASERLATARAALDALPPAPAEPPPEPKADVKWFRIDAEQAATRLALTERQATEATTIAAALAELRAQQAAAEEERDAWELLADALGRNGIQAMEIDAAGPDLTARINELLHGCFGTRWTVLVDTSRQNDKGEPVDGLPILVTDAETDREDDIGTFSGGERKILGRALSLAVAGYVCQRTGAEGPTVVLDETGDGISVSNTEPFVTMVRQAAREIGASKTLIVTHNPEVAALCDAVVTVADGALKVDFVTR